MQTDHAVGAALVLLEHFRHTALIVAQHHQILAGALGEEEIQINRLFQLLQNLPGAVRQGVQLLFGKVQTGTGQQHPGGHVEGKEGQQQYQQAGTGIHNTFHLKLLCLNRPFSGR